MASSMVQRTSALTACVAAAFLTLGGMAKAQAPVQYVKVCAYTGDGFYYIPGTNACIRYRDYFRDTNFPKFGEAITVTGTVWAGGHDSFGASSSSGYFDGRADSGGVFGGGVSIGLPIGMTRSPAGSQVGYGAGINIDWLHSGEVKFGGTGGFGAFAVDGKSSIDQFNILVGPRFGGPIGNLGFAWTAQLGSGISVVIPTGQPIGTGGPRFDDSDYTWAIRVGMGLQKQVTPEWSVGFTLSWQHTGPTEFRTSLAGERFRHGGSDTFLFGWNVTTSPAPRPPVREPLPVM